MQGTAEWFALRCGRITASRIADIMGKKDSAGRRNYISQLVAERLTGQVEKTYTSEAMQHGIDTEVYAREFYAGHTFQPVTEIDFCNAPDGSMSGASLDGLVGDDGLLEIKCPNTSTHIGWLLGESIPKKYIYQMQWQMYCSSKLWCDFLSFDNRLSGHESFIKRIERDDIMIENIRTEVKIALEEIEDKIKKLNEVTK